MRESRTDEAVRVHVVYNPSLIALAASTAFAADTHKLTRVYEKLATERPIAVVIPEDGSGREFLALQRGKILILPKEYTCHIRGKLMNKI